MKDLFVNELRRLKPSIRRNMLLGKQVYNDQERPPTIEQEWDQRMKRATEIDSAGGTRVLPPEYVSHVMTRDTIKRSPHPALVARKAEVDSKDEG